MKAVLSKTRGGPDALSVEEVPGSRDPQEGEIRIAVRAVGINFPDLLIIEDRYQFKPERPFSPGAEVAGIVEATGPQVHGLRPGDRVLAMTGWGGMAEELTVEAWRCAKLPDAMPFEEAAAFLMTYGTSYHALRDRAALKSGETLLVLGAAGGVGLAAVELGKAIGARVIAAASSQEKLAVALKRGAADGLVYPPGALDNTAQRELSGRLKAICGQSGADVIYDPVGGDYAEPALRTIAWEGRYLVIGFPAGIPRLPLNLPLLKACDIRGVFWGAAIERNPQRHSEAVDELFELYLNGSIKPHIHRIFPLEQAAEALKELASRKAAGKIVVTVP